MAQFSIMYGFHHPMVQYSFYFDEELFFEML